MGTVILAASPVTPLEDKLGALAVIEWLTPAVLRSRRIVGGDDISAVPVDLSDGSSVMTFH